MFDFDAVVLDLDVGEGVGLGVIADEHGVALGIVSGTHCARSDFHEAPIAVAGMSGADAFGDYGASRVFADVDHFASGVGLLVIIG